LDRPAGSKNKYATQGLQGFGNRLSQDGTQKSDVAMVRGSKTTKDVEKAMEALEVSDSFKNISHKQSVIEFDALAPSKVMTIEKGVELIEKGKSVRGEDFSMSG